MSGATISSISASSPARDADILVGDELIAVNGREPTDIIEYQQLIDGERVTLLLQRPGRALRHKVTVEKGAGEPLGLSIDSAVFDRIRTCDNHCSFCFIYQLPKGLRRSLYVKDDDFRLSFLYGNYTTLTRFTEFDLERVLEERLSPLYVSIHTTDPDLRAQMLRNPRGATSLRWLSELLKAGVAVHAQVVVCPGVNDGENLERTLQDVLTLYPQLESVALVPVGVSAYSTEEDMRPHRADEARHVIALAQRYRDLARRLLGRDLIFASDEFYLVAEMSPPSADAYPSLDEAENGIGMVAAFAQSFLDDVEMPTLGTGFFQSVDGAPAWGYRADTGVGPSDTPPEASERVVILTGEYAAPLLVELLRAREIDDIEVWAVENRFFGGNIKVAGLLTGADLNRVLDGAAPSTLFLLPDVCLSEGRFLDGMGLDDLVRPVRVIPTTGQDLRRVLDEVRTRKLVSS